MSRPEPDRPARHRGEWTVIVALVAVAAVTSWGWTILEALSDRADVEDRYGGGDSAVQISQLVDQALLHILPLVLTSVALSFAAVVAVLLASRRQR